MYTGMVSPVCAAAVSAGLSASLRSSLNQTIVFIQWNKTWNPANAALIDSQSPALWLVRGCRSEAENTMQTPFGIRLAYPGGSLRYAGATLHASQRALHSSQAMTFIAWFIFIGAALLEVSGDAAVRQGLRSPGFLDFGWVLCAGPLWIA